MKKSLAFLIIFMCSVSISGQNQNPSDFVEQEIEGGSTFKKFKNGQLDSIIVTMAAVNYGNALIFSISDNHIRITNAADENSVITIELKNKKQIRTLLYKNKPAAIVETIDFHIDHLPKNAVISSLISDNLVFSNTFIINDKIFGDDFSDKTFKLFYGLSVRSDLNNLDAIFQNIGDFFSQEDALLKIFYGSYAEKFAPQLLAYLHTDDLGKIKNGILMDFKNKKVSEKNNYNIYKNGKIIKSGTETLSNFQKIYFEYRDKSE